LSVKAFSSRRSSLTQPFVESCVDFEVAYLSVVMVWRLPYPEIPTLIVRGHYHWTHPPTNWRYVVLKYAISQGKNAAV